MTNTLLYMALQDLHDVLLTCTVSNMPLVEPIYDEKSIGVVEDNSEKVFLKPTNEKVDYYLHADDTFHWAYITIDVWTYNSLARLKDLISGIFNTLKTNARFSINSHNYSDLLVIGNHPLSDQYRNIWRHSIDVQLRLLNPTG